MSDWEIFFEEKIGEIAKEDYIVDIGGGLKFGKGLSQYEKLFESKKYVVLDKEPSYNPDIIGDIHDLPLETNSVDAVVCKAVLEHVEQPWLAVKEIHRVLKPGGKALFYVPFLYPYHAERGTYKDFYRFSKDAVEYLFGNFSNLEYVKVRGFFETWFYFLPGRIKKVLSPVGRVLDRFIQQSGNQTSGFNIYVIK
ncbi:hypothetical protein CL622_06185 [archaeon]|nr:hypothetical protein [archaeon]